MHFIHNSVAAVEDGLNQNYFVDEGHLHLLNQSLHFD